MKKTLKRLHFCGKRLQFIIFLSLFSLQGIYAQESINVTGKVTDEKGLPIPAVSVKVKGLTQAVSTDGNGSYAIKTAVGATLVFQYLSYTTQDDANHQIQPFSKDYIIYPVPQSQLDVKAGLYTQNQGY